MSIIWEGKNANSYLVMGNDAFARGALEAGVKVVAGYPGTPSSEIIEQLSNIAKQADLYVEWSVNEKVALEVAAAASFAELRSMAVMKQNGVNVASDFLLHLSMSGTRAGMVLIACEDPGALSSVNEGDARTFARLVEIPLLEPGNFQEAKDMTRWAFELSEQIQSLVMVRSVTRMSHASGNVQFGPLPETHPKARFQFHGNLLDQQTGPVISAGIKHVLVPGRLAKLRDLFEDCPFNTYQGPDQPELLIITSSACNLYSREAVNVLGFEDRVGILKLGTTWPLPPKLLRKHLGSTQKIMVVEEVLSFLEDNVKIISADAGMDIGPKIFYGKTSGHIPSVGELNPDLVIEALSRVFQIQYQPVPKAFSDQAALLSFAKAPGRDMTFCPGCPHRASFWSIHNALALDGRNGFVCGDIGCYTMAYGPTGFDTLKTIHSMGSGAGLASGFAKLRQFGMDQPVLAACGDSTFFHAAIPALINAVHHQSDFTLVILDNSGTAMTGFQSHPGLKINAMKEEVPALDIEKICRAVGARVEVSDPFDLEKTRNLLNLLMEDKKGAKVLILRKACALSPERKTEKKYSMKVDEDRCRGANCGCNRLCTRVFKCPGLIWNESSGHSRIDEAICVGCGVCGDICPEQAIIREEN
ncbi:MAG: 4Fe-4S binding protein [Proteobacteria bacterium]|nr:4Fe-4S binding protein [Pseudomonadota bacterium]MBU4469803.1 4Fe-4S binding protein [Pseudomonadota bacterium]MCG2753038.1 thiamine pyrophosphate-dependent enzyme [Desulfobacteraceae bacterium]